MKRLKSKERFKWGLIYTAAFLTAFVGSAFFKMKYDPTHGKYSVQWSDAIGKVYTDLSYGNGAANKFDLYVLFKNASTLSTELTEARDTYQLGKLERQLAKADLLILDELSYLSFNRYESDLLFKVISDRSEQSSTIVTTNLPFARWTELFENTTMVSALVDRCGSYVVKIQRSCRFFVSKRIISRISLNSPLKALDNILK